MEHTNCPYVHCQSSSSLYIFSTKYDPSHLTYVPRGMSLVLASSSITYSSVSLHNFSAGSTLREARGGGDGVCSSLCLRRRGGEGLEGDCRRTGCLAATGGMLVGLCGTAGFSPPFLHGVSKQRTESVAKQRRLAVARM